VPYAEKIGFKGGITSAEAAEKTAPIAENYRARVLSEITKTGGSTADEIAAALRASILTVRPRVSELHKAGRIRDTGARRANSSGHRAVVWGLLA
jgi:predicted ArsR family transcriptional regulator